MSGLHDFASQVVHSCKNIERLTLMKDTSISRAICQKLSESNNFHVYTIPQHMCELCGRTFYQSVVYNFGTAFLTCHISQGRNETGLKLPSKTSVVRVGVTGFFFIFCLHAANDGDKPAFDEPTTSILQT